MHFWDGSLVLIFFRLALPDDVVELDQDEGLVVSLVMRTMLVLGARLGDMARRAATVSNSWRASGCEKSSRRISGAVARMRPLYNASHVLIPVSWESEDASVSPLLSLFKR